MGNSKSKKVQKEPDGIFNRERWKQQKREEKRMKNALQKQQKRVGVLELQLPAVPQTMSPAPVSPTAARSYDQEALERMRRQLHHDSDAFLLNNILLSVQFFENYERELHHIKNDPISDREHSINAKMVQRNKHVFFADRIQECVHEHVCYQRQRGQTEPLVAQRLYVIYDNVEASEPGDTSDYSAVLDAPFYKLRIEDCNETGYVKLKKIEVLGNDLHKNQENTKEPDPDDSLYTDSEKESIDSDESVYVSKGEELLERLKSRLQKTDIVEPHINQNNIKINRNQVDFVGRRPSGPTKEITIELAKSNIANMAELKKTQFEVTEEDVILGISENSSHQDESDEIHRKSILKVGGRLNGLSKDIKNKIQIVDIRDQIPLDNLIAEDTETSGYRSNSSSRQTESSETESDYGYSTITESATPKKIELNQNSTCNQSNYQSVSGALPDESWTPVQTKAVDQWCEDDKEIYNSEPKLSLSQKLYQKIYYLNSLEFMNNFVYNFIINLGSGLGLTEESIKNSLSQGASIYCDSARNGLKIGYEVYPSLNANWPNAANQWIIRERRIIQNPRTNFTYQWPTKFMVSKAVGFGCLLVPIGFRPKRGINRDQNLQWKIIFPAAERYLESCLAHSHMRCYLFTLALYKAFMENETSKVGIDPSHIKNHLFWECEDNYAKWPEDRLGEALRLFLRHFKVHFGRSNLPNYFIENCNEFKSIPQPLLMQCHNKLKNILETPVTHILHAIDKLKYNKRDFYPTLNCQRLYEILTCKYPLRILNPNLPAVVPNYSQSSDSEDETDVTDFWNKAKAYDKQYQWKKANRKQMLERRKAQLNVKKQKSEKNEREIKPNIMLPIKMEPERRRLVLEFFIPHFIAMARSSEKFEAIRQALIYLEQAQRLCVLLLEEPAGGITANEYMIVIRDKLADCQRKLVKQGGFMLPPRRESYLERNHVSIGRQHSRVDSMNQDSPVENNGIPAFTFVDVHIENSIQQDVRNNFKVEGITPDEESKL